LARSGVPTKYKSVSDHWTKEPIEGIGPSLNFTYANVVGAKKNLGILVTGTWHSQPGSKNRAALMNYQNTLDQPAYVYRTVLPRLNGAPRTRLATGVKLDYKLGPNSILTLNSVYNWFHENSDTRTLTLATAQSVATLSAAGVPTGTGRIMPGYTETMTEVIAAANSTSAFSITTVDKSGATVQLTPSVTHRFDRLQIDYGASWSESRTYYDNHDSGRKYDGSPKGTISASLANVGWKVDRSRSREWPTITQTTGPDIYDLGNYRSLLLTQPNRTGMDRNISARFNINRQFTVPVPASIKAGLSYRREDRDIAYDSRRYTYLGGAAISQFLEQPGKWAPKAQGDYRQPPVDGSVSDRQGPHPASAGVAGGHQFQGDPGAAKQAQRDRGHPRRVCHGPGAGRTPRDPGRPPRRGNSDRGRRAADGADPAGEAPARRLGGTADRGGKPFAGPTPSTAAASPAKETIATYFRAFTSSTTPAWASPPG
jgi:hypothetical protein